MNQQDGNNEDEKVDVCDGNCNFLSNGMGDEVCTRCGYDSMIPSGYEK